MSNHSILPSAGRDPFGREALTPGHRRSVPVGVLLPPDAMQLALRASLPGFGRVQWVERTGSTNADLYRHAREPDGAAMRPWLLGAHLQDHGRGRAGRTWQNRRGANLMFSCAFDVFLPPWQLPALAPLAGLAACEALRRVLQTDQQPHLAMKWPNDIQWQGAKLAGILVEVTRAGTARLAADHHVAIVGMGLNLEDGRALSQSLNRRIADWAGIAGARAEIPGTGAPQLVTHIAQAWQAHFNEASQHGLGDFPQRYAKVDALAGLSVDVIDNGALRHTGVAVGINTKGQLLLRSARDETAISVGEISVRAHERAVQP